MERSIPQGAGDEAVDKASGPLEAGLDASASGTAGVREMASASEAAGARPSEPADAGETAETLPPISDLWVPLVGYGLVVLCLLVYFLIHLDRPNAYLHFVLQAEAWLDGNTSIPLPGYQDVMPVLAPDGSATGRGIIPFPPFPAWVLLPFVAIWREATNQQLLSAIGGAIDVGLAYWMLGRLPIQASIRAVTALFLGLGTVLFYTAAIGTTWFWAHIVAVAVLVLAVGLALSADPIASEPRPIEVRGAVRGAAVPGRWRTVSLVVVAGAIGVAFLILAGSEAPAATLALLGLVLGLFAALVAVAVTGRWQVLAAPALVFLVVVGVPGLFLLAAFSFPLTVVVDLAIFVAVVAAVLTAFRNRKAESRFWSNVWAAVTDPDSLQIAAGVLFGLAVTARLTILFGFPFFMLVGGGGTWLRRTLLAGAGASVPLLALLLVTYATSGQLFNPAYDYLYRSELLLYGSVFDYNAAWAVSDIQYVPQNLMLMLFQGPEIAPDFIGIGGPNYGTPACLALDATRGLFDTSCPLAMPNATGMSLLLTSPAFLIAPFALGTLRHLRLDRATAGAAVAVVAIAFANLMHFSQGWVQFGYRFSNDFVPFALLLVALGTARLGWLRPLVLLVVLSIIINFWGTIWGTILAW